MKSCIRQLIRDKGKILVFLLMGCSTVLYGDEVSLQSPILETEIRTVSQADEKSIGLEEQLQQAAILPMDYHDKVFVGGDYTPIYEEYKISSKNSTIYLPLRLMTTLITQDKEWWEARWDATNPNEVILVGTYKDAPQILIKLQVGSKNIIYNKKEIVLTAAPEKMDGRIVLPLRALAEALNKQITYKDGLVFISEKPLIFEGVQAKQVIREIKERLQDPRKILEYRNEPVAVQNIKGQTYYTAYEYNSKTQVATQKLYSQKVGKETVLLKEIQNFTAVEQQFMEDKFYYGVKSQDKVSLYTFDLGAKNDNLIGEFNTKGMDFSSIRRVIPKEEKFYFTAHYGDWTMGSETLYCIQDGRAEELTQAKQFGSIIIEEGKIYYSDCNTMQRQNNLLMYDEESKEITRLGEDGYTYDIDRAIEIGGEGSHRITESIRLQGDKLYALGYEEEGNQTACLYSINPKTGETKKLTLPTSQFWIIKNQIYYIETTTKYLITVDLEGNNKKTLISKSIAQAKRYEENFYYTLLSSTRELSMEFYKYSLGTDESMRISSKRVKDFFISSSRIYYVTTGYDAGLYKIQDGTTVCLEKQLLYSYQFDGEHIVFLGKYDTDIRVIK